MQKMVIGPFMWRKPWNQFIFTVECHFVGAKHGI